MPYQLGQKNPTDPSLRWRRYHARPTFHSIDHVWARKDEQLNMKTTSDSKIIGPEQLINATREALDEYPKKRLLVHFTQPHLPYLGETGQQLHQTSANVWRDWLRGELDADLAILRRAYEENVELVVDAIENLLPDLPGKTVVTADHGELLYDRVYPFPMRDILHPRRLWVSELVEVPWIVVKNGKRKSVREDYPEDGLYDLAIADERAEEHLEALGYL